jgi:dTDP-4-dehydrorhamnose 3,5-epimerase
VIFAAASLSGAFILEPERLEDPRGFFARMWCALEFEARGLNSRLVQCSLSFNKRKGTLRGLHYQVAPSAETKLIRCTMGAIYDVIVDLRPDSPTYKRHLGAVLTAENRKMLYVPEGCAHGFQTLADDTEVFYQMSEFYSPEHTRGVRWNDPVFGIPWPEDERTIIDRDRNYPDFSG